MPPSPSSSTARRSARLTGYLVVILCLGMLAGFGIFLVRDAARGPLVWVRFPELATLSEGDPVVERGVAVGRVERITLRDGRPHAGLRFFHHRDFPADTRFVNLSHSLMGARTVWMIPGSSPAPLDLARPHRGEFAPGLPETLHKVDALVARVRLLRTTADSLLSAGAAAGLLEPLDAAHALLNTVAASVNAAAITLDNGIASLRAAGHAADHITGAVRSASSEADTAAARTRALLAASAHAEATIAAALTSLESLTATLQDSSSTADDLSFGRLLNDRSLHDSLLHMVQTLGAITRTLKAGGLGEDITIRPRL